jgi:ferritin-like metal-binding protein YciE
MKIETLDDLLQEELKDIYDAEKQLVKALPKMAKAASSEELRSALEEHLEVTKGQVQRLEQAFDLLGAKAKGKTCAGMKGLIQEGQEVMEEDASEQMMDAALIGAAQRVEHYEIASYGTARTFAERLGHEDVARLMQETLSEEEEADEKLTQISESLLAEVSPGGAEAEEEGAEEMGEEEDNRGSSRRSSSGSRPKTSSAPKAKRSGGH